MKVDIFFWNVRCSLNLTTDTFVFQNARDSAIYIGTSKNTILEGSASKKTFKIAVWGHTGKLEAIAAHPDDLAFVSAGK